MTLDPSTLASALADVFALPPETATDAADALAAEVLTYSAAGTFGSSTPQFTPAHESAFAATLLGAISDPAAGAATTFAAAWAAAIATLWVGVPVVGAQAGATVACPGAAALTASLTAVFGNLANTPETCGQALATAIHAATLTVTAAVAPPPGTVLPIA